MAVDYESLQENTRFLLAKGIKLMANVHNESKEPAFVVILLPEFLSEDQGHQLVINQLTDLGAVVYELAFEKGDLKVETIARIKSLKNLLDVVQEVMICARKEYHDLPLVGVGVGSGASVLLNYNLKRASKEYSLLLCITPLLTSDFVFKKGLRFLLSKHKTSRQFNRQLSAISRKRKTGIKFKSILNEAAQNAALFLKSEHDLPVAVVENIDVASSNDYAANVHVVNTKDFDLHKELQKQRLL